MLQYPKEFKHIVEKAKSFNRPWQVAVAGANSENILKGVFAAQEEGFVEPILIGNFKKTKEMLDSLGLADRKYDFYPVSSATSPVQYAIEMIQAGSADVLVRGNIQTRDFLLPIMNKSNHLIKEGRLVTHISVMKSDEYDRLLAVSDCTLLVEPSIEQREEVIRTMTEALKNFGIEKPNIALLSLVEKPSFHMKDTVEAQTIVMHHNEEPIADCNLYGPITYDLIISKEAAELKHCPNRLSPNLNPHPSRSPNLRLNRLSPPQRKNLSQNARKSLRKSRLTARPSRNNAPSERPKRKNASPVWRGFTRA